MSSLFERQRQQIRRWKELHSIPKDARAETFEFDPGGESAPNSSDSTLGEEKFECPVVLKTARETFLSDPDTTHLSYLGLDSHGLDYGENRQTHENDSGHKNETKKKALMQWSHPLADEIIRERLAGGGDNRFKVKASDYAQIKANLQVSSKAVENFDRQQGRVAKVQIEGITLKEMQGNKRFEALAQLMGQKSAENFKRLKLSTLTKAEKNCTDVEEMLQEDQRVEIQSIFDRWALKGDAKGILKDYAQGRRHTGTLQTWLDRNYKESRLLNCNNAPFVLGRYLGHVCPLPPEYKAQIMLKKRPYGQKKPSVHLDEVFSESLPFILPHEFVYNLLHREGYQKYLLNAGFGLSSDIKLWWAGYWYAFGSEARRKVMRSHPYIRSRGWHTLNDKELYDKIKQLIPVYLYCDGAAYTPSHKHKQDGFLSLYIAAVLTCWSDQFKNIIFGVHTTRIAPDVVVGAGWENGRPKREGTFDEIWKIVNWSLKALFMNRMPTADHAGKTIDANDKWRYRAAGNTIFTAEVSKAFGHEVSGMIPMFFKSDWKQMCEAAAAPQWKARYPCRYCSIEGGCGEIKDPVYKRAKRHNWKYTRLTSRLYEIVPAAMVLYDSMHTLGQSGIANLVVGNIFWETYLQRAQAYVRKHNESYDAAVRDGVQPPRDKYTWEKMTQGEKHDCANRQAEIDFVLCYKGACHAMATREIQSDKWGTADYPKFKGKCRQALDMLPFALWLHTTYPSPDEELNKWRGQTVLFSVHRARYFCYMGSSHRIIFDQLFSGEKPRHVHHVGEGDANDTVFCDSFAVQNISWVWRIVPEGVRVLSRPGEAASQNATRSNASAAESESTSKATSQIRSKKVRCNYREARCWGDVDSTTGEILWGV